MMKCMLQWKEKLEHSIEVCCISNFLFYFHIYMAILPMQISADLIRMILQGAGSLRETLLMLNYIDLWKIWKEVWNDKLTK